MFGTLADFDALVDEAHRLGLRVMIDLVISHTSDEHPWFRESRASRDNAKADWYVWADAKPDGTPPNNWLSIFGGSAWQWDARRRQYYLHNFLAEQPDLNFHSRAVQDALLDTVRFWLERGVDGFRLDTINFYFHSAGLEDNPALPESERNDFDRAGGQPVQFPGPHLRQEPAGEPRVPAPLPRLLDEYPAVAAVGEVGDAQRGLEVVAAYTSGGDRVQMCYSFDFLGPEKLSAGKVRSILETFGKVASDGWSCWALSNHDVVRHATRWGKGEPDKQAYLKVISALLMSLRGSVCIYQGEELGLDEAELRFEDLQDPYGIRFWPEFKGRDGCRTPMVWEKAAPNAGFSEGKPWLPVPADHALKAVDAQAGDPGFDARALSALPGVPPLLSRPSPRATSSSWRPTATRSPSRGVQGNEQIVCAFNLGHETAIDRSRFGWQSCRRSTDTASRRRAEDGKIRLGALSGLVRPQGLDRTNRIERKEISGGRNGGSHPQGHQEGLRQPAHSPRHRPRHQIGRVHRLRRPIGLRQVDACCGSIAGLEEITSGTL